MGGALCPRTLRLPWLPATSAVSGMTPGGCACARRWWPCSPLAPSRRLPLRRWPGRCSRSPATSCQVRSAPLVLPRYSVCEHAAAACLRCPCVLVGGLRGIVSPNAQPPDDALISIPVSRSAAKKRCVAFDECITRVGCRCGSAGAATVGLLEARAGTRLSARKRSSCGGCTASGVRQRALAARPPTLYLACEPVCG